MGKQEQRVIVGVEARPEPVVDSLECARSPVLTTDSTRVELPCGIV